MKYHIILIVITLTILEIQWYHQALSSATLPAQASSSEEASPTEYVKSLDKAKEKVSKWTRKVKQYVHSSTLDQVASNMISSLKLLLGDSIGIQGLCVESTNGKKHLNMTGGNLTRLHTLYEMSSRRLHQNKNEIEFEMRLAFRNLMLKYKLKYTSKRLLFTRKKRGFVVLQQKGLTLVTVSATVPKAIKSILRDTKRSDECYLTVRAVNVTTPISLIRVLKMVHDPFGITGSTVRTMVERLMEEVKRVVSDGLRTKIESALRSLNNVCKNDDGLEDGPSLEPVVDDRISPTS